MCGLQYNVLYMKQKLVMKYIWENDNDEHKICLINVLLISKAKERICGISCHITFVVHFNQNEILRIQNTFKLFLIQTWLLIFIRILHA